MGVEIRIVHLAPPQFRRHIDESLHVYVSAMRYPSDVAGQRKAVWWDHSHWRDFSAVAAVVDKSEHAELGAHSGGRRFRWLRTTHVPAPVSTPRAPESMQVRRDGKGTSPSDIVVGICYGYRLRPGQWWYDRVAAGVAATGARMPREAAELTELHVLPPLQGAGVGRVLLEEFLATRAEPTVMLSTPEVPQEDNLAWHLYRRTGFADAVRNFQFEGDPRAFAILQRHAPSAPVAPVAQVPPVAPVVQ